MPSEPETLSQGPGEPDEKQLCVSCLFPNEPLAHFCAKCGAPITSYAATGPFESIFAEGHVYRQAVERPRSFVVVLGVWLLFGSMALTGAVMPFIGNEFGIQNFLFGAFMIPISVVMIWKTTRSYFAHPRTKDERLDG